MEEELQEILYSHGVLGTYKGYRYFIRAVSMAVEEPERVENICQDIYWPLASEFRKDVRTIEKHMRTVRDILMKHDGERLLEELGAGGIWVDSSPYPRDIICIFAHYFEGKQSTE